MRFDVACFGLAEAVGLDVVSSEAVALEYVVQRLLVRRFSAGSRLARTRSMSMVCSGS